MLLYEFDLDERDTKLTIRYEKNQSCVYFRNFTKKRE